MLRYMFKRILLLVPVLLGVSFIWAFVRMVRFWKYDGVNPAVYLYPDEKHGPPGADDIIEEEITEGGAEE